MTDKSIMGGIDDYCWTADTLFSTINTPFPFPDPREIGKHLNHIKWSVSYIIVFVLYYNIPKARAGIADFIQPSLGPLQPNLDDFMNGIPLQGKYFQHFWIRIWCKSIDVNEFFFSFVHSIFTELIHSHLNSRLPPVPEEGTDDLIFRENYDFPALLGEYSQNFSRVAW